MPFLEQDCDPGTSTSGGHFSLSSEQKPSSRLGGARSRTTVPGAEPQPAAPAKTARKRSKGKSKAGDPEGDDAAPASRSAAKANGHSLEEAQEGKSCESDNDESEELYWRVCMSGSASRTV